MARRIGFLGPAGTFTEEAALLYAQGEDLSPFNTITAVGSAVCAGMVDEGVVPIENSLEGSVNETLDLLIQEEGLFIRRELVLPIRYYVLARPGTRPDEVQVIYSHPQALGQCRRFLERCFPRATVQASLSTSAAVAELEKSPVPAVAIASRRAADLYPVEVMAQVLLDNPNNFTRFVVLAREDHPPTGDDKTSICFSYNEDRPGLLYETLGEFARRDINLAKIESRPTKQELGRYIFLADLQGHRTDPPVASALSAVRARCSLFRVFGSYPRYRLPPSGTTTR